MSKDSKLFAYIGFSVKKGAVVFGIDQLEKSRRKVHLLVCSASLAENSRKKAEKEAVRRNCPLVTVADLEKITNKNCKILGICDIQLAKSITENC